VCLLKTARKKHDHRTMCIRLQRSYCPNVAAVLCFTTQPQSHKDACVHSTFAHGQQARTTLCLQVVKVDSLCPELASLCWSLPSANRPPLCPLHLQSVSQQVLRNCTQHIIFDPPPLKANRWPTSAVCGPASTQILYAAIHFDSHLSCH